MDSRKYRVRYRTMPRSPAPIFVRFANHGVVSLVLTVPEKGFRGIEDHAAIGELYGQSAAYRIRRLDRNGHDAATLSGKVVLRR